MVESTDWWKPCVAEFIGTFALVFIGAGAIVAGGNLLVVALAHGLAIAVMITALGHVSGGHFNPAVTIATIFTKKIRPDMGFLYIVFQLLGAVFGAALLAAAFSSGTWEPSHLGTPAISSVVNVPQAVIIEAILTFFLVFVVFGVGIDARNHMKPVAGLAIGFTVSMDILMGGPLTGAAMNPARAFGTALVAREWTNHLVYWLAPILGGILAGLVYDTAFLAPMKRSAPAEPGSATPTASAPTEPGAPPA